MSRLLETLDFTRGPAMKNRFMLAPLTNSQSFDDGTLSDDEYNWLVMRARGGFGMTMTCAAHVQARGQGFPGQLGIFVDEHLPGLTRLSTAIKHNSSIAVAQLYHGGMRSPAALIGDQPVGPVDDRETGARALTTPEVQQVVEDFVAAAVRAERAGFDGVELHAAHGYLICQFLSEEINQRVDRYGGSLHNRARLLFDIIEGIRRRCDRNFMLGVRLSPERFGMKLAEIIDLAQQLIEGGQVDFIDLSLWDVFKEPVEEDFRGKRLLSYFTSLTRNSVRLFAAGAISTPDDAERAMEMGADAVVLGRAAILHHDFPLRYRTLGFVPTTLPVSRSYLHREGLAKPFIDYMAGWEGFVEERRGEREKRRVSDLAHRLTEERGELRSASVMRLTQGIHRAMRQYPSQVALISGNRRLSWAEFGDRVARMAAVLQRYGLEQGDRVAMLAHNSAHFVEFYFATLWAGGVILTINTRWALPEMVHCLNDAEARILLVDEAHAEQAVPLRTSCESIVSVIYADGGRGPEHLVHLETALREVSPVADAGRGGEDLAALFYTGGTTGKAKGVMLSHNNFLANAMNALVNLGLDADTVHLHVSPLFHLAGGSRVFSTTVAGATHAVIPRFEPELFLDAIEKHRVNVTVIVPTMLNALLQYPRLDHYDLSSLRLLTYGASPMPEALLRTAMERFPDVAFLQSYGMTELSPVATMLLPRYHVFTGPHAGRIRSAGRAVFNADVEIKGEQDEPLPTGEVGEICVRGPMVMQGYWGQPELTRQTLRGGWMHTGDAGYLDKDGFLFLVDRVKDMIISGGENVYSAAVENVLYQFAGVHECAVIGVPDDRWGEAVYAVVVPKPGAEIDQAAVLAHCRQFLASYECPKQIDIRHNELAKSGAGKILKSELRKPFWEGRSRAIN